MSSFGKSVYNEKSLIVTECQRANNDIKADHKRKKIISLRDGNYYCIYLVEENGQKILLNKIPVNRFKNPKNSEKPSKYYILRSCGSNTRTLFKYQRQIYIVAAHQQNVQRITDIIKRYNDSE